MNYYVLSDIHLEYVSLEHVTKTLLPMIKKKLTQPCTLFMCGDISSVYNQGHRDKLFYFFKELKTLCKAILYVPGNHEYYGSKQYKPTLDEVNQYLTDICNKSDVTLLIRDTYEDDTCIVYGCTLWSHLPYDMSFYLNDLTKIAGMHYTTYNELHAKDSSWLKTCLLNNNASPITDNKKVIVLTHHLPTEQLIQQKYKHLGDLNMAYYSHMECLFPKVDIWCCGHSHQRTETVINTTEPDKITTCIINAVGYKGEFKDIDVKHIQILNTV